jgi:hypothetical protein
VPCGREVDSRVDGLCDAPLAAKLWAALRRAFPDALACVLMPNHVHLVVAEPSAEVARDKMRAIVSGMRRADGGRQVVWERVALPSVVPDVHHLRRLVRYIALNPSRLGLVRDPLEWVWSTYRDVVGAFVDPWVPAGRLAAAFRVVPTRFVEQLHLYVSSDPDVSHDGTPFPEPALPTEIPSYGLDSHRARCLRGGSRQPRRSA